MVGFSDDDWHMKNESRQKTECKEEIKEEKKSVCVWGVKTDVNTC